MALHERLQLRNQLGVPPERGLGPDSGLQRDRPQPVEARDRVLGERRVREVSQRLAAPEPERRAETRRRACMGTLRECGGSLGSERLEAERIDTLWLDLEHVAPTRRHDRISDIAVVGDAECAPQSRDVDLQGLCRGRRRFALPQIVDQAIAGNDLVRPQGQHGEHRRRLCAAERDIASLAVSHAKWSEDLELDCHESAWSERTSAFYRLPERFTGLKPFRCLRKTGITDSALQAIATGADRPERRRSMSTLQHTLQPAVRHRLALLVVLAGALAALTVALIVSSGGSDAVVSAPQPTPAAIQRQLEFVSAARYGTVRPPTASQGVSPQRQLEALAGARYQQMLAARHDR